MHGHSVTVHFFDHGGMVAVHSCVSGVFYLQGRAVSVIRILCLERLVLIAIPIFPWVVFFIYRTTRTLFVWNYFRTICYGQFVADAETPSKASERPASLRVSDANSLVGIELHGVVHNSLLGTHSGSDAEGCAFTV